MLRNAHVLPELQKLKVV